MKVQLKVWNSNYVPNNSVFHRNPADLHKIFVPDVRGVRCSKPDRHGEKHFFPTVILKQISVKSIYEVYIRFEIEVEKSRKFRVWKNLENFGKSRKFRISKKWFFFTFSFENRFFEIFEIFEIFRNFRDFFTSEIFEIFQLLSQI